MIARFVADVAGELGRRPDEARPVGIVALQRVEVVGQILDPAQCLPGVAVPQPPLDPLQPVLDCLGVLGVVVRQALRPYVR